MVSRNLKVHWLTQACSLPLRVLPGETTHFSKHLFVIRLTSSLNTALCCSACREATQVAGQSRETTPSWRLQRLTCSIARSSGESSIVAWHSRVVLTQQGWDGGSGQKIAGDAWVENGPVEIPPPGR